MKSFRMDSLFFGIRHIYAIKKGQATRRVRRGRGEGVLLATRFGAEKRCCHNVKSDSDGERIILKKNKFLFLTIVFSFSTKIVRQATAAASV